jgi:hypothetical protein
MVRIFFDTEFADLTEEAALISIGLVDEAGNEFYSELSDTYSADACSDFCRREVFPHLEGGGARRTLEALRVELRSWLSSYGRDTVLVCDSPRDISQIRRIFPHGLPTNVSCEVLGWWSSLRRRFHNRDHRLHRHLGLRVHHALDDARVNRFLLSRHPVAKA